MLDRYGRKGDFELTRDHIAGGRVGANLLTDPT
jgi:hypothetical protein